MKETTPSAMPPCFEKWCRRFDDVLKTKAEKREFRHYLGGLLGESKRKNLSEMARNAVGVTYHRLHHFLTDAKWSAQAVNERRLEVMNQCRQSKIQRGFSLIIDDSGHRKSGNFTAGVGRQDVGEIGKTDNGIVVVTTHLYDGKKSLPLDLEPRNAVSHRLRNLIPEPVAHSTSTAVLYQEEKRIGNLRRSQNWQLS